MAMTLAVVIAVFVAVDKLDMSKHLSLDVAVPWP